MKNIFNFIVSSLSRENRRFKIESNFENFDKKKDYQNKLRDAKIKKKIKSFSKKKKKYIIELNENDNEIIFIKNNKTKKNIFIIV